MSDNSTLEKIRTVRLSADTNRRIEAVAAEKGTTPSEMIRQILEAEFSLTRETPGQWLLKTAKTGPKRKPHSGFAAAYRKRHAS